MTVSRDHEIQNSSYILLTLQISLLPGGLLHASAVCLPLDAYTGDDWLASSAPFVRDREDKCTVAQVSLFSETCK